MAKSHKAKFKKQTHFGGNLKTLLISKLSLGERPANEKYNEGSIKFHIRHVKLRHRISPPVVERTGPNTFRVIDGWHRLKALQKLRIRKAKVEVV